MHGCSQQAILALFLMGSIGQLAGAAADDKPFAMLASFDEVEKDVPRHGPNVLLDARPRADYEAGHVEGAIWVDVKNAQAIAARPGGLTDRAAWEEWTAPLGLDARSTVRVMDGERQLEAARIWWLLRYLGVEKVGLIDGNFSLWKSQRRPTTQESSVPPSRRPFPVDFQRHRLATREDVLATLQSNDARIVDARTVEEWTGSKLLSKRGGHIPAACRVEWTTLVDPAGRFLARDLLQARLDGAGAKRGKPVVTHCQGGGRASVDAFVCELLGYPTRNFYLGWSDWGNADETPVTTDDEPARATKPPAPAGPAGKPFTVEYYYKCQWGLADEFLELFQRNHLPILRERIKQGDILTVSMTKPRIHTSEGIRWDFRVTIEFRDAAAAFNAAADEPIKQRLFPDQQSYKLAERRRFTILDAHTDLPIEEVNLDGTVTAP